MSGVEHVFEHVEQALDAREGEIGGVDRPVVVIVGPQHIAADEQRIEDGLLEGITEVEKVADRQFG